MKKKLSTALTFTFTLLLKHDDLLLDGVGYLDILSKQPLLWTKIADNKIQGAPDQLWVMTMLLLESNQL